MSRLRKDAILIITDSAAENETKKIKRRRADQKRGFRMPSINDVAKRAKVAKSTVSLVLNNSGYVSEETRKKVEDAIRELDYQPSQLARNLSYRRTNLVGVIIPDVSHPFYGTFLKYAEDALYRRGYKTMVCQTVERENMELEFLSMLKSQTMDGIIMGAHSLKQEEYVHLDRPVVAFDRDLGDRIPIVRADHEAGGRQAARLFLEKGCQQVVQVRGASIVSTPAHRYHTAFAETMEQGGVKVGEVEMPHNAFGEEDFARAAAQIFAEYPEADGIFGADLVVQACLKEAEARKLAVPGQLHLLAYDGTYVTRTGACQVNAIVQPIQELACSCVEKMDRLIQGQAVAEHDSVFPVGYQEGMTL